jgi:hypothetical protein
MPYDHGGNCWNCGAALTALDYGRADTCKSCGRDTKTCKGCVNFDANAQNQCRESQAERVVEKERSNFCDWFKPAGGGGSGAASRDSMKAAAEALFKKK